MSSWRDLAACLGEDPELFFALEANTRDKAGRDARAAEAKAVCNGGDGAPPCPVRAECLDVGRRETAGVWGGLTAAEREAIRRRVERAATRARKAART